MESASSAALTDFTAAAFSCSSVEIKVMGHVSCVARLGKPQEKMGKIEMDGLPIPPQALYCRALASRQRS
jgi:hypothetical protein